MTKRSRDNYKREGREGRKGTQRGANEPGFGVAGYNCGNSGDGRMSMMQNSTIGNQATAHVSVCVDLCALPSSLRPNLFSGD
jgi:hypothetical protein